MHEYFKTSLSPLEFFSTSDDGVENLKRKI